MTRGFNYYLKYFLNCHVSWDGNQFNEIKVPLAFANITISSPNKFIYYSNICTHSYSFAWWKETEWHRHLDWMALQGVNLLIAPVQEEIWTRVYRVLKMKKSEIDEHFAGPAFLTWQRLGNIRGWGGPLSDNYKKYTQNLQKQIITAARRLGMIVAIPGFSGHVPKAFLRLFPQAKYESCSQWMHFKPKYSCSLFLNPADAYFKSITNLFLKEVIKQYGTDHIYFMDPYNDLKPISTDLSYIQQISQSIYDTHKKIDDKAVWLLQGWMFRNPLWTDDMIKTFVTANEIGSMLILDLQSEQHPIYSRSESYYGQPFIWCMLHNFGGTSGMIGSLNILNNVSIYIINSRFNMRHQIVCFLYCTQRPIEAKQMKNSSMVGFGVTMEGINQNYFIYEFALEMGWVMSSQNLETWVPQYVQSRYGSFDNNIVLAWDLLARSVYNFRGLAWMNGDYIFNTSPALYKNPWVSL